MTFSFIGCHDQINECIHFVNTEGLTMTHVTSGSSRCIYNLCS